VKSEDDGAGRKKTERKNTRPDNCRNGGEGRERWHKKTPETVKPAGLRSSQLPGKGVVRHDLNLYKQAKQGRQREHTQKENLQHRGNKRKGFGVDEWGESKEKNRGCSLRGGGKLP